MTLKGHGYEHKIKSREELKEILGSRPRKKKAIMCHGTFDLVHPGHVRHLLYAKSKADFLIASLTCDAYISKANYRPYVPQDLRALNLAALELVDYVVIDENPTPIENIKFIEPDFFAKGYEYGKDGVNPKTQEEVVALESYGGQVIFTPGDIVYSSSSIINVAPPDLKIDKLLMLMKSEGITFDSLRAALEAMKGVKVHVIGDTIVDSYTFCSLIGGTAKTPTFSVKYERQDDYPGGAAVVAKHIRRAGGEVRFSTVLGNDSLKDFVLEDLKKYGIECDAVIDETRPTTQKNAFITNGYRMLKVDKLDNNPITGKTLAKLKKSVATGGAQAYVFSDFRHGIFNRQTIPEIISAVPAGAFRVADSQVANRWGNILDFQDFDLITPNEREARFSLGDQDSTIRPLAMELYKKAKCKLLMLKLGEKGMITYRAPSPEVRSFFTVDSFVERLVDAVGSGDALLAYSTLALIATKSDIIASILGSMAAAIACEHDGNNPVAPEEVLKKINKVEKEANFGEI